MIHSHITMSVMFSIYKASVFDLVQLCVSCEVEYQFTYMKFHYFLQGSLCDHHDIMNLYTIVTSTFNHIKLLIILSKIFNE